MGQQTLLPPGQPTGTPGIARINIPTKILFWLLFPLFTKAMVSKWKMFILNVSFSSVTRVVFDQQQQQSPFMFKYEKDTLMIKGSCFLFNRCVFPPP